jgi:peptidoglycan/LPS O-acetylase OafA/YrhL
MELAERADAVRPAHRLAAAATIRRSLARATSLALGAGLFCAGSRDPRQKVRVSEVQYIRSLDGLRAIAILLVMGVHFHALLPFGWVGVQLFFVLSGFLITRILAEAKPRSDLPGYLGTFYMRRALRIFPLYFGFMLLLELSSDLAGFPGSWPRVRPWAMSYTLNFAFMLDRIELNPVYAHFWSLAVEEQFYLVWPFVVWLASPRTLRFLIAGVLIAGPLVRGVVAAEGLTPDHLYFLTVSHVDAFAAGAAVATWDLSSIKHAGRLLRVSVAVAIALGLLSMATHLPGALNTLGYPYGLPEHHEYVWGYTMLNVVGALAVLSCLRGELRWLEQRWLVRIGQISYGLYVLHRPFLTMLTRGEAKLARFIPFGPLRGTLIFAVYVAGSLALAQLSYSLFESKFLALKSRFPGAQPAAVSTDNA